MKKQRNYDIIIWLDCIMQESIAENGATKETFTDHFYVSRTELGVLWTYKAIKNIRGHFIFT